MVVTQPRSDALAASRFLSLQDVAERLNVPEEALNGFEHIVAPAVVVWVSGTRVPVWRLDDLESYGG